MSDLDVLIAKERRELMDLLDGKVKPGGNSYKVPNRRLDENLLLATWNIQNLGNTKTKRALQYIADICERFDVIALQEIKTDLRGLSQLQGLLPGGDYRVLVTDPTGNNERFAFLYDRRTVRSTGLVCEIGFPVSPAEHTGFQLHRMPYCASFKAGRFDFIVVNVHIFYGKSKKDEELRVKEIDWLVDYIRHRTKTDPHKVFDRDFFVVGDFNIEKQGDRFFKSLRQDDFKMPPNLDTLKTNFFQNKTFDKIAWVDRKSFRFGGHCNVVPFSHVLFRDSKPKGGKKEISDHFPVWAEFRINELTQELDQTINPHP
jgi:exonuclease III